MEELLRQTYNFYEEKLQKLLDEMSATKDMLNLLAKDIGMAIPYPDNTKEVIKGALNIKKGQFYNKPLATAVREYLQLKGDPASWEDIVSALKQGDYFFEKSESETRLTVVRNTMNFVLLSDNHFGLKDWYNNKTKKDKQKSTKNVSNSINEINQQEDPIPDGITEAIYEEIPK